MREIVIEFLMFHSWICEKKYICTRLAFGAFTRPMVDILCMFAFFLAMCWRNSIGSVRIANAEFDEGLEGNESHAHVEQVSNLAINREKWKFSESFPKVRNLRKFTINISVHM